MQFVDSVIRGRSEGILLLAGGLTIHNLRDRICFDEIQCADIYRQFDKAVTQAVQVRDVCGLSFILSVYIQPPQPVPFPSREGRNIVESLYLTLFSLPNAYSFSRRNGRRPCSTL